jgi:hypothetical protein
MEAASAMETPLEIRHAEGLKDRNTRLAHCPRPGLIVGQLDVLRRDAQTLTTARQAAQATRMIAALAAG